MDIGTEETVAPLILYVQELRPPDPTLCVKPERPGHLKTDDYTGPEPSLMHVRRKG